MLRIAVLFVVAFVLAKEATARFSGPSQFNTAGDLSGRIFEPPVQGWSSAGDTDSWYPGQYEKRGDLIMDAFKKSAWRGVGNRGLSSRISRLGLF